MKEYRKRIIDNLLQRKLESTGAVLVEGPKGCGKTTTAEQIATSSLYLNDPSTMEQNLAMADLNPYLLLKGKTPRLIDEYQLAPKLWNAIRHEVDHRENGLGQFILTGSSVLVDTKQITHTGAGRFSKLRMRTMSLYELGESNGEVSLKNLFEGNKNIEGRANISLEQLAFFICRGGWPDTIGLSDKTALEKAKDHFEAIVNTEIKRADNVKKNEQRVRNLMRAYAEHQGSQVPNTFLAKEISQEGHSISEDTVTSYLNALRKIFVVEDLPSWLVNLRTKTPIRTMNTHYFVDPSIAVAALGYAPNDLLNNLKTFGFLYKTLCIRDLRIYADASDGQVYHYRDKENQECDAVIELRNGSYGLVEIKLGGDNLIEMGVKSLLAMKDKIDTTKMKEPSFLMVLTGIGNYAYRRKDGVLVCPIGCLKD